MSVSITNPLFDRWFRSPITPNPGDSRDDEPDELTVVSGTPFNGGEHLIVSAPGGLVQLFVDAEGNEILADHATDYGRALAEGTPLSGGTLHGEMPAGLTGRLLPGEWTNSPLVFADDSGTDRVIVKVYRRLEPGPHPEVEVLSAIPSPFVPALLGHVTTEIDGETYVLASVQQCLEGSDGFAHTALHAEAQMASSRVSSRFGETLRMVHDSLAMAFPTSTVPMTVVSDRLEKRLDSFVARVPELSTPAEWVRVFYQDLSGECEVQRIHGHLTLHQTLFDETNWKFLDFEGDPSHNFAQRRIPRSPLTDLAGALRSLDYASKGQFTWMDMTTDAILEGYGISEDSPLLNACIMDRAFEDMVRDSEQQTGLVDLPRQSLARLRAQTGA